MTRQPNEFISTPEPPETFTALRRPSVLSSLGPVAVAVGGAVLVTAVRCVGVVAVATVIVGLVTDARFSLAAENCSTRLSPEQVEERVRTIQDLMALEASIRARLPKAQPGIIIPPNLEIYR